MKFKTKDEYLNARTTRLAEAKTLVEAGKVDEANAITKEIEDMDAEFEKFAKAQANINALSNTNKPVMNFGNAQSIDFVKDSKKADEVINSASKKYADVWARALRGDKLSDEDNNILNIVNPSNAVESGEHTLVIPETYRAGIWEKAAEVHPVISDLIATNVKGDLIIIKDTSTDSDADWVDEDDSATDATVSEGELRLTGCELCKSITVSWKLKKMSIDEYVTHLITLLGTKLGNTVAKSCFSGKGKPGDSDSFKAQPRGVITALEAEASTPQVVEYDSSIEYSDLTALMGKVKSAYKAKSCVYANNDTIWNKLANILDNNGRPIFVPDVTNEGVGRIFGFVVKEEDGVPADNVVFGNFSDAYPFNFNEPISTYQEEHIKARTTDYMCYAIADADVLDTKAFAVLKKTV